MLQLARDFMNGPYWDPVTKASLATGVIGIALILRGLARSGWRWWAARLGIGFLAATILFSIVFESLLPGIETLPPERVLPYVIGLALYPVATVVLFWGARRLLRPTLAQPLRGRGRARVPPPGGWLRTWTPGLLCMGLAFLLFVLAGALYNEDHAPLAFLWPAVR